MPFQKGKPKTGGRGKGVRNKMSSFKDDLAALGLNAAQMVATVYAQSLKDKDYPTAQKAADTAAKYCYAVPMDTPEINESTAPPAVINLVVQDMSKPLPDDGDD